MAPSAPSERQMILPTHPSKTIHNIQTPIINAFIPQILLLMWGTGQGINALDGENSYPQAQ